MIAKNQSKLVVFDLFGVLFSKGLASSIDRLVAIFGRPSDIIAAVYRKWEEAFDLGKINESEFWERINCELGTTIKASTLSRLVLSSYRPKPRSFQLAKFMQRHYRVVIYSNFRREWYEELDRKHQISESVDEVFISSDVGFLKPDTRVFSWLGDRFDIKPEGLFLLDDEVANVRAAEEWGGHGVLFRNLFEADWALRHSLHDDHLTYDNYYSGILLRTTRGALVLQRRDEKSSIDNPGLVTVFGGRAEEGETPLETAVRELEEEVGLVVKPHQLVPLKQYGYPEPNGNWILASYFLLDDVDVNRLDVREGAGLEVWNAERALSEPDLAELPQVLIEYMLGER